MKFLSFLCFSQVKKFWVHIRFWISQWTSLLTSKIIFMDTSQTLWIFFWLNHLPNLILKWPGCLTRNHGYDSVRWSSRSTARPTEWEPYCEWLVISGFHWNSLSFFLGSNCASRMFVSWAGPEQQINRRNFVSRVLFSDKVGRGTCLEGMQGKL